MMTSNHCWCGLHVDCRDQCDRCMKRGKFAKPDAQTQQHLGQTHVKKIDAKAGEIPRTVGSGLPEG